MKNLLKLKDIVFVLLILIFIGLLKGCTSVENDKNSSILSIDNLESKKTSESIFNIDKNLKEDKQVTLNYDEVKDSLIRFHVIANSDSEDDQNLKIKVKNEVIDYLYPYLNKSESLSESREIIKNNMDEVKRIAEDVIKDNNYTYKVTTELSRENFPDKSYGNITLPQGNYEAFRIIIGDGRGKNWWCVMFPPLCFVDETKAEVEYEQTQNKISNKVMDEHNESNTDERKNDDIIEENNINEDENESDSNDLKDTLEDKKNDNKIQIKFKIVEIIESLFK